MGNKILITGMNSYVGNSFAFYCKDDFDMTKISLKNNAWKDLDFSKFDSILHVAGIAHVSKKHSLKDKYYEINTNLTYDLAQKAKKEGVKQFVFMSSIIVYGDSPPIGQQKIISKETIPEPNDFYGDSKLQAEKKLNKLKDHDFKVAIIRSPMIYGNGSKGNYQKLIKLAKYAFIFPDIKNQRSVLSIDNLNKFLKEIFQNQESGIFLPQDEKYFCTSAFIKEYRKNIGKKTILIRMFNPLIKLLSKKINLLKKIWGSFVYQKK
ncbi:NAD-dependent epimerase/dehydratase family protein [Pseudofrancisella aestuarii]|uniref:NAD-dependent epimerase/dehydratase family protein n=1 Tax=Pseudofrancisella aestuarii TaxID=2670347 RepID=A0ABV9TD42_9GAMM|nr:NAD-dependent epimerase/dehydratase family protein [Pseudofrancisella aestuarii]